VFAGSHEHTLDDKGRLVLPAPWRRQLEDGGFLAPWEHCLALFPGPVFWEVADMIQERIEQSVGDVESARRSFRYFMRSAREVSPDGAGRIVVPAPQREAAGIGRDALLIGMRNRIEIWDRGTWSSEESAAQSDLASVIGTMRL
jgi:MraZ protein